MVPIFLERGMPVMRFFPPWKQMKVGDKVKFNRTFTEGDVANFTGVTGDFNKFHMDDISAQRCGFEKRIIPGLLTGGMLTHAGGTLMPEPYVASKICYDLLAPVYVGETITAVVTVVMKEENKLKLEIICTNEKGIDVLKGDVFGVVIPLK